MKPLRLKMIVPGLVLAAAVLSGCEHKKPPLIVPQQQPPTVAPSPSPTPAATPPQTAEQPDKAQESQPSAEPSDTAQTQQKEAAKHPRKPSPRKPAGEKSASEVARSTPNKKIIPAEKAEPIPTPAPIAPGPTPADIRGQASTDQLLQLAESNLSGIKRTLSKDEEAMRAQIKVFIDQSRNATKENDPARAYNLALKARVLSDELVKQR
jgi:hypothetical protein